MIHDLLDLIKVLIIVTYPASDVMQMALIDLFKFTVIHDIFDFIFPIHSDATLVLHHEWQVALKTQVHEPDAALVSILVV